MRIVLSILILFVSVIGHGQYKPIFGTVQTSWNVFYPGLNSYIDSTAALGEVNLGGSINYHYMITDDYSSSNFNEFYLREDTSTGKVWFREYSDTIDYLAVDMSLAIGDTFSLLESYSSQIHQNIIVDSVYNINTIKHIQFNYFLNGFNGLKMTFIEGIGRNSGMSYSSLTNLYKESYLFCGSKDSVPSYYSVYVDSAFATYQGCYLSNYSDIKENSGVKVIVYPNPVINELTLKIDGEIGLNNLSFVVSDMLGRKVLVNKSLKKINLLNLTSLPNGLYYGILIKEGKAISSTKLIVSN